MCVSRRVASIGWGSLLLLSVLFFQDCSKEAPTRSVQGTCIALRIRFPEPLEDPALKGRLAEGRSEGLALSRIRASAYEMADSGGTGVLRARDTAVLADTATRFRLVLTVPPAPVYHVVVEADGVRTTRPENPTDSGTLFFGDATTRDVAGGTERALEIDLLAICPRMTREIKPGVGTTVRWRAVAGARRYRVRATFAEGPPRDTLLGDTSFFAPIRTPALLAGKGLLAVGPGWTSYRARAEMSDSVASAFSESLQVRTSTVFAPDPIDDLRLLRRTTRSVRLGWTATGNEEASGTALRYDLRFATAPITEETWAQADSVPGVPPPREAGLPESLLIRELSPGTTYYFGIKVRNQAGIWSRLGHVLETATDALARCAVRPDTLQFGLIEVGSSEALTFTVKNAGGDTLSGVVAESCTGFGLLDEYRSYRLAASDSATFHLVFMPVGAGAQSCLVRVGECSVVGVGTAEWKGSCCLATGECLLLMPTECQGQGGTPAPGYTSCDPNPCPQPVRVCCILHECRMLDAAECATAGGVWREELQSCDLYPCAAPVAFHVAADGSGDFPTIQGAVDAAADGDTIELADGHYLGQGNRDIDFHGRRLVLRSASRNPATCTIDCQGTDEDPHRAFVFQSGEPHETLVEGVSIVNGRSDNGGAISCTNGASPTLRNCTFSRNSTQLAGGGAIHCWSSASPLIEDCQFTENSTGRDGGAIFCSHFSSPQVVRCTFTSNTTDFGAGGALACIYESSPNLVDCTFRQCSSRRGGAAFLRGGQVGFTTCVFEANRAVSWDDETSGYGGAACTDSARVLFDRCVFTGNQAEVSGGALACLDSTGLTAVTCSFSRNSAVRDGGGLFVRGCTQVSISVALFEENSAAGRGAGASLTRSPAWFSPSFVDCRFVANTGAYVGGGLLLGGNSEAMGTVTITHCTFSGNQTAGEDPRGGGLYSTGNVLEVADCRFAGNGSVNGAGMMLSAGTGLVNNCEFESNDALAGGGAVSCESDSTTFNGCRFTGNVAGAGGVLWTSDPCRPSFTGCSFRNNSCRSESGGGVADCSGETGLAIERCLFTGNTSPIMLRAAHADVRQSTFAYNQGSAITLLYRWCFIEQSIIAFGTGVSVDCWEGTETGVSCSDIYGNAGGHGDWVWCIEYDQGQNGNLSLDPLFCDSPNGDFNLWIDSPCSADSSACGQMGALPVGCR